MLDLAHIYHALSHDPVRRADRFPAGAVCAGTSVELTLCASSDVKNLIHDAWLEVHDFQLGNSYKIPMHQSNRGFAVNVDTSGEPRVLFYSFMLKTEFGDLIYPQHEDETKASGFQLTIFDPSFSVPSWFPGNVMYQIFPDRFARGDKGILTQGIISHENRGWPLIVHEDWDEKVIWEEPYEPIDFYGGTLCGIEDKLEYIASLGVGVIYLNPIWEARSNHRYNTGDYE